MLKSPATWERREVCHIFRGCSQKTVWLETKLSKKQNSGKNSLQFEKHTARNSSLFDVFFVGCGYKQASQILILAAVREKQTHQKSDYHIKRRKIQHLLPVL